jgi:ABC-2 type transport system ATP-binding protein
MIGNPDVIFLDEPTAGLDVEGKVSLHDEIRKLKQQGKTIILASHDMAEVENLCDRIAILKNGTIAFCGTASDLTVQVSEQSEIYIKTSAPIRVRELNECFYEGEKQDYSLFTTKKLSDALLELLTIAKQEQIAVLDIKIERATLEQRFMDIAKEGNT